jgi:hypothetical protein
MTTLSHRQNGLELCFKAVKNHISKGLGLSQSAQGS